MSWPKKFCMLELFAEQPYDSIPNFSAADVLRLTGIGRNEFIDIMNKCRSKVLDRFSQTVYRNMCLILRFHVSS